MNTGNNKDSICDLHEYFEKDINDKLEKLDGRIEMISEAFRGEINRLHDKTSVKLDTMYNRTETKLTEYSNKNEAFKNEMGAKTDTIKDTLNQRPPLWATTLIVILSAAVGWLAK